MADFVIPRNGPLPEPDSECDDDGYTETWNDDQSGVVVTPCTVCSAPPAEWICPDCYRTHGVEEPCPSRG